MFLAVIYMSQWRSYLLPRVSQIYPPINDVDEPQCLYQVQDSMERARMKQKGRNSEAAANVDRLYEKYQELKKQLNLGGEKVDGKPKSR